MNVKKETSDSDVKEEEGHEEKAPNPEAKDVKPRVADVPKEAKEKTKGVVLKRAADPASVALHLFLQHHHRSNHSQCR